ncbi:MAG: cysteine desulfurase [Candidatus Wildermuthbacteria bacterium]|nr:cysteine desulfurase [Candidatus Wildermuthbacteria bacterium]
MKKKIYLDYAATTPIDAKVLKVMAPYLKGTFGNPSSTHWFGQQTKVAIEKARGVVASFLGASPQEIVFTSGATEANNLAIQGVARLQQKPHIVTSQIEHESVLSPCEVLEQEGLAEVTYVPVDKEGLVRVEDVKSAVKENTALVSIMYANSEIGTVQPIQEIGEMLQKLKTKNQKLKTLFHTDAVQAAQFLDCNAQKLKVDLLTISSHKLYGPKGAGALYIKEGVSLAPALYGGGQEQGMRSGTENTAAIVGMGAAIQEVQNPKHKIQNIKIRQLRDQLLRGILKNVKGAELTGSKEKRLANNIHVRVQGIEGRDMVIALDQKGIAVSNGSACSEKNQEPSHVLLALGCSLQEASSGVRITLGKNTTKDEIQKAMKVFILALDQLRQSS